MDFPNAFVGRKPAAMRKGQESAFSRRHQPTWSLF